MADLQFNEESNFTRRAVEQQSALIRLALSTGLVKTERGANVLLLIIAIIALGVTFFILFSGSQKPPVVPAYRGGQSAFSAPAPVTPR